MASLLGAAVAAWPRPQAAAPFAARSRALSEVPGAFDSDNLISNERTYLEVVPALTARGTTGGAYLGVGPDQNFSYIAKVRPAVAYIVDVRRDNLLLHLLFKAIFAESPTRAGYLALLLGRWLPEPGGPSSWEAASIDRIVEDVERAAPLDRADVSRRIRARVHAFGLALDARDDATLARFHAAFMDQGFELKFTSNGRPPRASYPTFRDLLLGADADGRQGNFLASEADYQFVRDLQARDAVVPVVGDLSGPRALRAIAAELKAAGLAVSAVYVSNVENYLFQAGAFGRYADNLAQLPRTPQSMVIRSIFRGRPSDSVVQPLDDLLASVADNRIQSYRDLVHSTDREGVRRRR